MFKAVINHKPNYIPTINNLAGYYHKINDPKNAIYYSGAIRFQPNNPIALVACQGVNYKRST